MSCRCGWRWRIRGSTVLPEQQDGAIDQKLLDGSPKVNGEMFQFLMDVLRECRSYCVPHAVRGLQVDHLEFRGTGSDYFQKSTSRPSARETS